MYFLFSEDNGNFTTGVVFVNLLVTGLLLSFSVFFMLSSLWTRSLSDVPWTWILFFVRWIFQSWDKQDRPTRKRHLFPSFISGIPPDIFCPVRKLGEIISFRRLSLHATCSVIRGVRSTAKENDPDLSFFFFLISPISRHIPSRNSCLRCIFCYSIDEIAHFLNVSPSTETHLSFEHLLSVHFTPNAFSTFPRFWNPRKIVLRAYMDLLKRRMRGRILISMIN